MLLSRVDMKTPVATMRKVGHLLAGEDTEGSVASEKKAGFLRRTHQGRLTSGTVSQVEHSCKGDCFKKAFYQSISFRGENG
jgi:hypothetical protein